MAKDSNIVHQYFRKELGGSILLVKVNPLQWKVTEITVYKDQDPDLRELEADDGIFEDLTDDGFIEASPMEFNIYLSGLIK